MLPRAFSMTKYTEHRRKEHHMSELIVSCENKLRIDPEFKSLIPPLATEEYAGLEESILAEGCRDALILWDGILIDGHNRYEICTRHNIPFETTEMFLLTAQ
jgi:DNA-binding transcriptional regulator/RsmH inhibitor MraZ